MRQLNLRLIAIGLLALAAVQLQPKPAQACIKFDRAAEIALIDEAIEAPKTPASDRAVLHALRKEMVFLLDKENPGSEDLISYHWLVTDALKRIGKQRVVWNGKANLDIGVFKTNKFPQLSERANDAIVIARCG